MILLGRIGIPVAIAFVTWRCFQSEGRGLVSALGVYAISVTLWFIAEMVAFPSAVAQYPDEHVIKGVTYVACSVFATLFSYSRPIHATCYESLVTRSVRALTLPNTQVWRVFLFATAIGFLPLICIAHGRLDLIVDDAIVPRRRFSSIFQRSRYGDSRDAFLELQVFLQAAVMTGTVILFAGRAEFSRLKRVCAGFLIFYVIARAINDSSRMTVVQSTLPVAAGLYWASADHLKVLLVRVGLPLAGILAGTWAVASCVGREEGRFEWKMATQANYTGFEMFRELLFITDAIPERADYEYGGTYLVQVVNPIPRFIWPEKPREDAGLKLARLQGEVASTGEPRLSVAPGMIGEMYWNFGLTGIVLLSLLGGQLLYIWDQFGRLSGDALSFVVFGSGFAVIFALGRSFNMSYFYPFAALLIVISVVRSPRNLVSLADIRNRD